MSYTRLKPFEVERIAQAVLDQSPARAVGAELGRSHSTVLAAMKSDAVLKIVYRERAKARHRQEEADRRERRAEEKLAARHIEAPTGRAQEVAAAVERRSSGANGRMLGMVFPPRPGFAATLGPEPISVGFGHHSEKEAWLQSHDDATLERARERDPEVIQRAADELAEHRLSKGLVLGPPREDGLQSLYPVDVALERWPELAPDVMLIRDRLDRARQERRDQSAVQRAEADRERAQDENRRLRAERQTELRADREIETPEERALRQPPLRDVL